jgi:transcription elongation factor GreB
MTAGSSLTLPRLADFVNDYKTSNLGSPISYTKNGDYIYGKKRLREIDRRIRFLNQRLEFAHVLDPSTRESTNQVFFGATITYLNSLNEQRTIRIVGVDEVDVEHGDVSWISPIAKAMLKKSIGDEITLETPDGSQTLEILDVQYL